MFLSTKIAAKIALVTILPVAMVAPLDRQSRPETLPAAPVAATETETVTIAPRDFWYRAAGNFHHDNMPVNGPRTLRRLDTALTIMRTQVSAADYERCVRARACPALDQRGVARADLPVVGVSWEDATAYAKWLSAKTGKRWRLPTDAEWAYAAASRYKDDAVSVAGGGDFTQRWIAKYEQESARARTLERTPRPRGAFGANENGLLDVSGNVWEWTDTCLTRQAVDADGKAIGTPSVNCGVRVVEGQHRTYVTNFIRDARAGGCSVGAPPANLGFRLVRDDKPSLKDFIAGLLQRMRSA
jgi:formylglycine-generating enzyme required for sulfatase activity